MWELYDELVEGIDSSIKITDYMVGLNWTYVKTEGNMGVATTVKIHGREEKYHGPIKGAKLKDIAALSKSWNFKEASLGAAAINAYYNSSEKISLLGGFNGVDLKEEALKERKKKDAFVAFSNEVEGKNVAVVGHFPNIEQQFKPICNLTILERTPDKTDYPDMACEYILEKQDYIFITGMTFINKTLPRLLEIGKGKAKISIVGPSIATSPIVFDYGVNNISGFCVTEKEEIEEYIRRGTKHNLFSSGRMVSIGEK